MADRPASEPWLDLAAAVLMGLASVTTAWCGYQASVWGGVQIFSLAESNAAGRKASALLTSAEQAHKLNIDLFVAYIDARMAGRPDTAEFYFERFPPNLRKAVDAWLETNPFENPDAPLGPFRMAEYEQPLIERVKRMEDEAGRAATRARRANRWSDQYVLASVLLASVLLFAGTAPRLGTRRSRLFLFSAAVLLYAVALLFVFWLPTTLGTR